jgi:hypothetical protein
MDHSAIQLVLLLLPDLAKRVITVLLVQQLPLKVFAQLDLFVRLVRLLHRFALEVHFAISLD